MNSIPPGDVEAIQNWAASIPVIKRVWIFGSRARGTARPNSDLDIAVEHDSLRGDSNAFTTVIGEAENWRHIQTRVGLTVDLESYSRHHSNHRGSSKRVLSPDYERSGLSFEPGS